MVYAAVGPALGQRSFYPLSHPFAVSRGLRGLAGVGVWRAAVLSILYPFMVYFDLMGFSDRFEAFCRVFDIDKLVTVTCEVHHSHVAGAMFLL